MIKGWTNLFRFLKLRNYTPNIIYPTIQYIGGMKAALDVISHSYVSLIGSDTVASVVKSKLKKNSVVSDYVVAINTATAHGLKRGDLIRFTSGSCENCEQRVIYVESTTKFYLSEPVIATDLIATDTFNKYRDETPLLNSDGTMPIKNISLDIVDQLDSSDSGDGVLKPNATTIPKRTDNAIEVVNSLAADCYKIQTIDDIGEYMALYSAADRSSLICFLPIAGGTLDVSIDAGTTIYLGAVKDDDITTDANLIIQFMG